jgi:ferredoxin
MHVTGNRDVCIGAGMCVLTAPDLFDQDDHGIVVVLDADPAGPDEDAAREAATLCPSGALRVTTSQPST